MKYLEALSIGNEVKALFNRFAHRIEIAGSTRRKKPTDIKDVELVMIPKPEKLGDLKVLINNMPGLRFKFPCRYTQFIYDGEKIDMFITTPPCWGCIFMIRTGSAEFSKQMMIRAKNKGMHFRDGRLWLANSYGNDAPLYTPEERDVFKALDMKFIKPEERA